MGALCVAALLVVACGGVSMVDSLEEEVELREAHDFFGGLEEAIQAQSGEVALMMPEELGESAGRRGGKKASKKKPKKKAKKKKPKKASKKASTKKVAKKAAKKAAKKSVKKVAKKAMKKKPIKIDKKHPF